MNRREFLRAVGLAAAATQIPSWYLDKPLKPAVAAVRSSPLTTASIDRILRESYIPALRQQLNMKLPAMSLEWTNHDAHER